jgi:Complex I intermediate-associated protein 30 (CIA30)
MLTRPNCVWLLALMLLCSAVPALGVETMLILDDRRSGDLSAASGNAWRLVTDGVMGGVSQGRLTPDSVEGRPCLRLRGEVSLEHNGGFVQAALDLDNQGPLDASGYAGIVLDVHGNGETYNVHLRTTDLWLPWQSYRASFDAPPQWQTLRLPFSAFTPYRTGTALDLHKLRRIGIVAIGRAFQADVCIGRLVLYRDG